MAGQVPPCLPIDFCCFVQGLFPSLIRDKKLSLLFLQSSHRRTRGIPPIPSQLLPPLCLSQTKIIMLPGKPTGRLKPASLSIALGSDPHISLGVKENGQIQLKCTSSGWFPEPEVQWRTPSGDSLPSAAESSNRDAEGLFTVAASVILTDSSVKNVSCCIQNLLLGQEKEVEISVPGQQNA